MNKYFQTVSLQEGVRQIKNEVNDCMYLIEGTERAALIDTGSGYGHLKDFVDTLTALPVIVLMTHGHMDHAGGSYDFNTIYSGTKDIDLMQSPHCSAEHRKDYVKMINPGLYQTLRDSDFTRQKKMAYIPVYEGDIINLGNRKLMVTEVPGHTVGSVAYLDYENRIAFTGDAVSLRTIMFDTINGGKINELLGTVHKYMDFCGKVDHMYWGHFDGVLTKECIYNVLDCCIDILNRRDDHTPFSFMGDEGYSARRLMPDNMNRADGQIGNIVYNRGAL